MAQIERPSKARVQYYYNSVGSFPPYTIYVSG